MAIEIPLSKKGKHAGKYVAIVDDIDTDLAELNWSANIGTYTAYAQNRESQTKGGNGILLHRVILERVLGRTLDVSEHVDHINGNGLDNRRENLRLSNKSQNGGNSRKGKRNTSGYKGVGFFKGKWRARIYYKKEYHLGLFNTPEEAHEAYCEKAKEFFGEFWNNGDFNDSK